MKTCRLNRKSQHVAARSTQALAAILAACLFSLSAHAALHAADLAQRVHQANEALAQGKIDEALAAYQQAAAVHPARPELAYNEAVAHYRKGEYDLARDLFTQATETNNRPLEARARYNLADCDYAEAVKLANKDRPAAIQRLQQAISHYRGALQANPDESEARANIELAQMLIQKLQQEENQQKQDQQKQDQQKQDQQKQDQQKQDQQKQDQKKQDQPQDQQKQDQQKQGQQKQDQKKDSEKQNEHKEQSKTVPQKDKQESKPDEANEEDQKQKPDQQQDQQQDQQPNPQVGDKQTQQPSGQQPKNPDKQLPGTPQYGGQSTPKQKARPMTVEEAQKMLQAVRDRDLMRRLEQRDRRRSRHIPVDKDW